MCKTKVYSSNFLVNILNVFDDTKIELSRIADHDLWMKVSCLTKNYVHKNSKTGDIKMKINLTDEIPFYCSS